MLETTPPARYGSVAMLLVEAGLGVVSVAAYAVLVLILRPEPTLDIELGSKSLA